MALCSGVMCSCADEDTPIDSDPVIDAGLLDTISEHLHFSNATRIQGNAPTGPSIHSLKISFKDTLYLTDTLSVPVKFQHLNSSEDITGIYLQLFIGGSGGVINASHYYDVPEDEATEENDTVSTFLIGIKKSDLPLPVGSGVRIIAHKNGKPIAESVKEIVV